MIREGASSRPDWAVRGSLRLLAGSRFVGALLLVGALSTSVLALPPESGAQRPEDLGESHGAMGLDSPRGPGPGPLQCFAPTPVAITPGPPPTPPRFARRPLPESIPELAAALADFEARRVSAARARLVALRPSMLDAEAGATVAYWIARADAHLGWHPEAEVGFDEVGAAFPELAGHLDVERTLLARAAGDDASARSRSLRLGPREPRAVELVIASARLALEAVAKGDLEEVGTPDPEATTIAARLSRSGEAPGAATTAGDGAAPKLAPSSTVDSEPTSGPAHETRLSATRRVAGEARAALDRIRPGLFWRWEHAWAAGLRARAVALIEGPAAGRRAHAEVWRLFPDTGPGREALRDAITGAGDPTEPLPVTEAELLVAAASEARTGRGDGGRTLARTLETRLARPHARGLTQLLALERHPKTWALRTAREATAALNDAEHPEIRAAIAARRARALAESHQITAAISAYAELCGVAIGTATEERSRELSREQAGENAGTRAGKPAEAQTEAPTEAPPRTAVATVAREFSAPACHDGGRLAARAGRDEAARALLRAYFERAPVPRRGRAAPPGDRARALWTAGWLALRSDDPEDAIGLWRRLMDDHPNDQDRSRRPYYERALFWVGHAQATLGDRASAEATWRFLVRRAPLSYYAVLAAARLGAPALEPAPAALGRAPATVPQPTRPPDLTEVSGLDDRVAPALALWRMGDWRGARDHLRQLFEMGLLSPAGSVLMSAMYRERRDLYRAHWIISANDPLDAAPDGDARQRWLSAYPRPFSGPVESAAKRHTLDPLLIWAVMRQESAFRAGVQSHAGAVGLMQVLPATARAVARKLLKERQPNDAKVLEPWSNVNYGAAYLRHQLNRYDGNLALALAAYNAGPGNVDKWLAVRGHRPTDAFVEEIPFDEARGYVRKVLSSYAAYRALYGPPEARIAPFELSTHLPGHEPVPTSRESNDAAGASPSVDGATDGARTP